MSQPVLPVLSGAEGSKAEGRPPFAARPVAVAGTGSYVPEKVLSNADLEKMVDTSDAWIQQRTGISERRIIQNGMATSDMASRAARKALEAAGASADEVQSIVVGTITPDHVFPSASCLVQRSLGARYSNAMDVSAACSGFLYALAVGKSFVASGRYDTVLVVGADAMSTLVDYKDRTSCILFGDGAGAVLLRPSQGRREILYDYVGAEGGHEDVMVVPAGGSRQPASHKTVEAREHYLRLKGNAVFKFAVLKMVNLIRESVEQCKLPIDEVSLIVPHQVNRRIIEAALEKLKLPAERCYTNIHRYGNTSAGSVPIALDEAAREGRIKSGDIVLLCAFGAGLTWGSAVIRW